MDTPISNKTPTPTLPEGRAYILKVGGAVVEDPASLAQLIEEFAAIEGPKVLVHGGGRSATRIAARLGIESHMADGRRITDQPMLDVVTMVYGGLVNKQLVAQLQAAGTNALGLTGADANLIRSHRRPVRDGIDYGCVGDVAHVDSHLLSQLIERGITPVIAPLTHDGQGHLLNTNADTIASHVACALAPHFQVTLKFAFEKRGLLLNPDDPESLVPHITETDFLRLRTEGTISGGMLPKLENAFAAIRQGVSRVLIGETLITST